MPECENCGAYVTKEFVKVFGTNDGEVHGCLDCVGGTAVKNGASLKYRTGRTPLGGADS